MLLLLLLSGCADDQTAPAEEALVPKNLLPNASFELPLGEFSGQTTNWADLLNGDLHFVLSRARRSWGAAIYGERGATDSRHQRDQHDKHPCFHGRFLST